jgi:hypothetical protein
VAFLLDRRPLDIECSCECSGQAADKEWLSSVVVKLTSARRAKQDVMKYYTQFWIEVLRTVTMLITVIGNVKTCSVVVTLLF